MSVAWINDAFVEESEAQISIRDTGLLHSAGVFTTMRAIGGKVFRLTEHLKRLRESCDALFIPLQYKDERLSEVVGELLSRNELAEARLRLTVTRGTAVNDPLHGMHLQPTVFVTAAPMEPYPAEFYAKGMTVIVLDEQKLNPYDLQAGHKTLNYFSRLAALREANRRAAGEALWFNVHNYLQSASISNVFIVKAGTLITPPTNADLRDPAIAAATPYPKSNVLPGVTRGAVVEIAGNERVPVKLSSVTIKDLLEADELFLTNSIMGVMPVARIEREAIGSDKPGEITRRIADRYQAMSGGAAGQ